MEKPAFRIAMLGAGNVASHLAPALQVAGHQIPVVYSRTLETAQTLAAQLKDCHATTSLDFREMKADLFLIAVKDEALPELLAKAIFPENSLVAHTSGTVPLSVFAGKGNVIGAVFYPLQTFSRHTPVRFENIPFCLECPNENARLLLQKAARSLSRQVYEVSSDQRKVLHLAAVFASNFTNHLLGISHQILKTHNLDFAMLQPLVTQTVTKAFSQDPFAVQTGPAIRHDETTIQTQLQALENEPAYRQLYELLSRSIQQTKL